MCWLEFSPPRCSRLAADQFPAADTANQPSSLTFRFYFRIARLAQELPHLIRRADVTAFWNKAAIASEIP
jgi:hypothetical protein